MPAHRSRLSRAAWRGVSMTGFVAVVYVAGVLTGMVTSHGSAQAASSPQAGGILDQAEARISSMAARPVARGVLQRGAIEGMLKALGDRWASYYSPGGYASFQQSLDGRYTGVGLWLRPGAAGGVQVASVQPDSSAGRAGIVAGDMLLSVAGHPVDSQPVTAIADQLSGDSGTVTVQVGTPTGTRTLRLSRASFATQNVTIERLVGQITVIHVLAFTHGVGAQVRAALATDPAAYAAGIVLDLRGNPGGLITEAVAVASAFLDGGPVVTYEQRGEPARTLDATGTGNTRTPLVVLVDGQTASAAEIVTAALQERNRAVVVGSQTFGKGSVQQPTLLSDGSAIELTVGHYLTPSGRSIDGVGITPDVIVPAGAPSTLAEARALEVLNGLDAALAPVAASSPAPVGGR
ncbi:MAG: S41 family peptidase [Actinomycetes bacterium]